MSLPMLKNYIGIKLSDEEIQKIDNPELELNIHVTFKTVQALTFVGSLIVSPIINTIKGPRTLPGYTRRFLKYGSRGFLIGIPLGPILTYIVTRNDSKERNYDRCFRLRHNKNQLNVDRFTTIGGIAGACAYRFIGVSVLQGLSLGIIAGIFSSGIINIF